VLTVVLPTEAWMSLCLVVIHRELRVHGTGGSVGTFQGAQQTLSFRNQVQHHDSRRMELKR
jgi:hypothetical protein